jgi:hypothetical protein
MSTATKQALEKTAPAAWISKREAAQRAQISERQLNRYIRYVKVEEPWRPS